MRSAELSTFFEQLESELSSIPNELRRLFHGRGRCWEGLEQITADWLQGQLVVQVFKQPEAQFIDALRQG